MWLLIHGDASPHTGVDDTNGVASPGPGGATNGGTQSRNKRRPSRFRGWKIAVLNESCVAEQAYPFAFTTEVSNVLCGCLSKPEFRIEAGLFRTIILERVPLQVVEVRCDAGFHWNCSHHNRADSRRGLRTLARVAVPRCGTTGNSATWIFLSPRMTGPESCSRQVSLCFSAPHWRWTTPFGPCVGRDSAAAARMDGALCARTKNGSFLFLRLEDVGARSPSTPVHGLCGGSENP